MLPLLRRLTVDQWRAIDRDFRDPSLPPHQVAAVLITVAIAVIIEHYYGGYGSYRRLGAAKELFAFIPHPSLRPRVYWAGLKLVYEFLLPLLCIKLVLRGRLRDHGLTLRGEGRAWRLYVVLFLAVMPFVIAASFTPSFQRAYPRYPHAGSSISHLWIWMVAYGFQFVMLEFFYRGFMIFALARVIGSASIFVMIVPYTMIHFGKPMPEAVAAIVAGVALGTLALRTRSIVGGVLIHCGVGWGMELLALVHSGHLRRLLE